MEWHFKIKDATISMVQSKGQMKNILDEYEYCNFAHYTLGNNVFSKYMPSEVYDKVYFFMEKAYWIGEDDRLSLGDRRS